MEHAAFFLMGSKESLCHTVYVLHTLLAGNAVKLFSNETSITVK